MLFFFMLMQNTESENISLLKQAFVISETDPWQADKKILLEVGLDPAVGISIHGGTSEARFSGGAS